MASHSPAGIDDKSICRPYFRLKSESQTQVLISYSLGNRGQADETGATACFAATFVEASVKTTFETSRWAFRSRMSLPPCRMFATAAHPDVIVPLRDLSLNPCLKA